MGVPYATQLADKEAETRGLLAAWPAIDWLPTMASAEFGFRNKAKMVVGGTVEKPTLGILDPRGRGVDLRECGLHDPRLRTALPVLAELVGRAGLTPYSVPERRGELKHLLVTVAPSGDLMVRFVLRSTEAVPRLRKHLPGLLTTLPVAVASVNLQPTHQAILEGPEELPLHGDTLTMRVNDLDLHLRPQSFFQTNTAVAARLYREAAQLVASVDPASVWDLYCGVGGFGLHVATPGRTVTGVESSEQAIDSAALTATSLGVAATFLAGDATAYALAASEAPELVIVNPPRRGIGSDLAGWLEASSVRHVVYSSCNAESLARDLALMPSLRAVEARVLDMFPHTTHFESLALFERANARS